MNSMTKIRRRGKEPAENIIIMYMTDNAAWNFYTRRFKCNIICIAYNSIFIMAVQADIFLLSINQFKQNMIHLLHF